VPSRVAARLVTGPVAFLLGWVIDVLAYAAASAARANP
jgi:sorbitol-specific phosphotransferase system component IIBC